MGRKPQVVDAWPLVEQLADAGINPAMLEAYSSEGPIAELPDADFFTRAIGALDAARKTLGTGFDALDRESRLAVLDVVLTVGADQFSPVFKGPDTPDEGAILQALENGAWKLPKEHRKRAIASMQHNRLVFRENAINQLRDGTLKFGWGLNGPAVFYVHRLLQVALRFLGSSQQLSLTISAAASKESTDAISAVQTLAKLTDTGHLDTYTLAYLEALRRPGKSALPPLKTPHAPHIENKKLLFPPTFSDYDRYLKFKRDLSLGITTKTEASDLSKLKYPLSYIQVGQEKELRALKQEFEKKLKREGEQAASDIKDFVHEQWKGNALQKTAVAVSAASVFGGGGLFLYNAGERLYNGRASSLDKQLLAGANDLVKLGKLETNTEKQRYKPTEKKLHVGLTSSEGVFQRQTISSKTGVKEVEKVEDALGFGTEFWGQVAKKQLLPLDADPTTQRANGFTDDRVWYCARTCSAYHSDALRDRVQAGELTLEDTVVDITSRDYKQTKLLDLPWVANTQLYSNKHSASAKGGLNASAARDPEAHVNLFKVGAETQFTWGPGMLKAHASYMNLNRATRTDESLHDLVNGAVFELGSTLQAKIPVGLNSGKRTNTLEASAGIKKTLTTFERPLLNTSALTTNAGMKWNVTHQDKYILRLSLVGAYSHEDSSQTSSTTREATFQIQSATRKFTVTADVTWKQESTRPRSQPAFSVNFIYHIH